jgi:hypothetical protein
MADVVLSQFGELGKQFGVRFGKDGEARGEIISLNYDLLEPLHCDIVFCERLLQV